MFYTTETNRRKLREDKNIFKSVVNGTLRWIHIYNFSLVQYEIYVCFRKVQIFCLTCSSILPADTSNYFRLLLVPVGNLHFNLMHFQSYIEILIKFCYTCYIKNFRASVNIIFYALQLRPRLRGKICPLTYNY